MKAMVLENQSHAQYNPYVLQELYIEISLLIQLKDVSNCFLPRVLKSPLLLYFHRQADFPEKTPSMKVATNYSEILFFPLLNLHFDYFHYLVSEVVDYLYCNAAGFGTVKWAGNIAMK